MGYTHYFEQHQDATPEQWQAITNAFKQLHHAFPLQREHDDKSEVEITDDRIAFNGIGGDRCETMSLKRTGRGFDFCKTARKPYDGAVIALLILCNHYAPDVWSISSDGSRKDWIPTLKLMVDLGVGQFALPPEI